MRLFDLIVVGGGPAGCSAAITAARNGAKVLLLERSRFPRHKVCGEFVSAESLDLLANLLTEKDQALITAAPRISQGRIFADSANIRAKIKPAAASITRFELDAALWRSCCASGVDARQSCTVDEVERSGPFGVRAGAERFNAKAVINATGRWSNLTKARFATKERWIGIKSHFCEASPPASVDLYFFEGGYCGVQPIAAGNGSGAVNACAMVKAEVATTMPEVLTLHPALRQRSETWTPITTAVTTSPLIFHEPEPVFHGMLQAGDSATFVDPFIGDGISLALRSGALAAECLTSFFRGDCTHDATIARYERAYQRNLVHIYRASSMLRRLMRWPVSIRRPILTLLEKAPRLVNHLVRSTR